MQSEGPRARTILVDGFNVLHTVLLRDARGDGWWKREQRERLLRRVAGWRGGADEIWVAFDGSRPAESVWAEPVARAEGPSSGGAEGTSDALANEDSRARPTVRSLFAESADDWIVRRARKAEQPERILVVSADRKVAGRARSAGVEVLSPWSFIAECDDHLEFPGDCPMIERARFEAGMERQLAHFARACEAGMPRRGWKVGINVPEILKALDLPHSAVGWIDGNHVLESGGTYTAASGSTLMIEPEVAIFVSRNVGADATLESARGAIGAVAPALEIVDLARAGDGVPDLARVLESSMFHAATVLGPRAPLDRARELGQVWPKLRAELGAAEAPGHEATESEATRSDLVPADLAEIVRFVGAYLAEFGASLDEGDLILSGSYTAKALPVTAGWEAFAEHGPIGEVRVAIGGERAQG